MQAASVPLCALCSVVSALPLVVPTGSRGTRGQLSARVDDRRLLRHHAAEPLRCCESWIVGFLKLDAEGWERLNAVQNTASAEHDTARMWGPGIWSTPHAEAILLHAIGRTAAARAAVVDAEVQRRTSLVTRLPEDADIALAPAKGSPVLKVVRTILL